MANKLNWTTETLMNHPKRDSLLGLVNTKIQQPSPPLKEPDPPKIEPVNPWGIHSFTVMGEVMGKPRMTRRDTWKKRPVVIRYRDYCDRIRAAAGTVPQNVYSVIVHAHMPVPASASKKKKALLLLMPMQVRPDWDNIGKAVCDALFEEDSMLAGGIAWKFWCEPEKERTEVHVLYLKCEPN